MYFANLLDRNTPLTHLAHLLYKTQHGRGGCESKGCRTFWGGQEVGRIQGDRLTGEAAAEPDCSRRQKEAKIAAGLIVVIVASSSTGTLTLFLAHLLQIPAILAVCVCVCDCVSEGSKVEKSC